MVARDRRDLNNKGAPGRFWRTSPSLPDEPGHPVDRDHQADDHPAGGYDVARLPRRMTFLPSDHDLVDTALSVVVQLAHATIGGVDGASVSLRRHGQLSTVAASNQTVLDMDADQYETGEGPCVDASRKGIRFHAKELADEARWVAFTPRARQLGINAILSSPLLANGRPVGALNLYSREPAAFTPADEQRAAVFAIEASRILTAGAADVSDEQISSRLGEALRARRTVAQAEGVVMERRGVSEDAAFAELRVHSVETGQPLIEWAEAVVSSTHRGLSEPHDQPSAAEHG
jgi:GAF domain-containing protein